VVKNQAFNVVYMSMWCFKTNHAQIRKSAPLLSIFSLKRQWTKDRLKIVDLWAGV